MTLDSDSTCPSHWKQELSSTDKILQAYVGRTQVSCVNILAPWAKWGAKWRWNGWEFFVTGTMNSHFFATVQIGMKFRQKCQSLSSIESYLKKSEKLPLRGWFCTKPPFFGLLWRLSLTQAYRSGVTFSTYRGLPATRGRANGVPTLNRPFVRLTASAVEAPKVTKISL